MALHYGAIRAGVTLGLFAMGLFPSVVWSQDTPAIPLKTISLYWENDSVAGSDRDYSNGLKLTWSRPYNPAATARSGFKHWSFSHLPFMRNSDSIRATSFSIGQSIYTPKDTGRSDLIAEDRPYAGYASMGFGFISRTGNRRNVWEFEIGVVGPSSHSETTQNLFHDIIGTSRAQGWDHQLENELGLEAVYEAKWQLVHLGNRQGLGCDLIAHLGAQAGNIATSAKAGGEMRFGWLIPRDFGTCPIRPGCNVSRTLDNGSDFSVVRNKFSFYFFTAVEGRAVLRDIFLDGNTFTESHHVDKEIYVADLMGGAALHYGRLTISYAMVLRTQEFKQRDDNHAFGAVNISYLY